MRPTPLPRIMVAPNGARRGKHDHAALPVTDDEVVETAQACIAAGAGGIHAHIRDANGRHLLDAGRYRALIDRLTEVIPEAYVQITSEAGGIYATAEQMQMVRELQPAHVSVALREMVRTPDDWPEADHFYHWATEAGVAIQHILYAPEELSLFLTSLARGAIPGDHHLLQFVLGTYDGTNISRPHDLTAFTDVLERAPDGMTFDWMLCAFGQSETDCLLEALRQGGKARIGFENSFWNANGSLAASNADRVADFVRLYANPT